ncbi:macro domain-containing protein [Listeria sp. FSL L7-1582]|uniref:macro domain-containing protein n=1 Tax=Listeria portnoyi TaxID=2713504 RepID=UPI00164ECF46|nr:macro domain-containing protein [Listeria portnoyi]
MIKYVTGNIFDSAASALVNTVNCEGYLGKGLAYQFKKKFPVMESEYKDLCKSGELIPGKLHFFYGEDKIVVNFPTKNKWRQKSKIEYIQEGLETLKKEIVARGINSIAIPPLGSGNGGLDWNNVKVVITDKLSSLSDDILIEVYEPSESVKENSMEPQSSYSTIFILEMAVKINSFNYAKLKIAMELSAILSNNRFDVVNLDAEIKRIRALKDYYNIGDNKQLLLLIKNKLISNMIQTSQAKNDKLISEVSRLVNKFDKNTLQTMVIELNCVSSRYSESSNGFDKDVINKLIDEGLLSYNVFHERVINYL